MNFETQLDREHKMITWAESREEISPDEADEQRAQLDRDARSFLEEEARDAFEDALGGR